MSRAETVFLAVIGEPSGVFLHSWDIPWTTRVGVEYRRAESATRGAAGLELSARGLGGRGSEQVDAVSPPQAVGTRRPATETD
jgi:hypothetical protein